MNYTLGRKKPIRLICIHTEESQEIPNSAQRVAAYLRGRKDASATITVDNKTWVQVVADKDTPWAAPGINDDGLHAELAGTASQNAAQWGDAYTTAMLLVLAKKCAFWAKQYAIPVLRLTPKQVADGKTKGFCGHIDATKAFPVLAKLYGSHSDPGVNFPWDKFLALVRVELAKLG